ncbi:MAG: ATP-binding cassette domain-containing protein, partial [Clostridiaceae bacterium]|nr:ATP-binding cassette domain-containing protein [Clostridiaceae bacterium]
RIPEVLESVGLEANDRKRVKYFSLGQRQRLGLARAMINRPGLLLLDEPVNGLDPAGVVQFRDDLKRVATQEGTAILISSHILSELAMLATRYGIIHEGR